MNEVLAFQIARNLPPIGKGERDSYDDLICWLQAIHVAQIEAGEQMDDEAWHFMNDWYFSIGD